MDQSRQAVTRCSSLFVEAERVAAKVNGRNLRGRPVPRDFAGRRSSTAFLAFSETWVRA